MTVYLTTPLEKSLLWNGTHFIYDGKNYDNNGIFTQLQEFGHVFQKELTQIHEIMECWDRDDDYDSYVDCDPYDIDHVYVLQHCIDYASSPISTAYDVHIHQGYEDLIVINNIRYFVYFNKHTPYILHVDDNHHTPTLEEFVYAFFICHHYSGLFFHRRFQPHQQEHRTLDLPRCTLSEHLDLLHDFHEMSEILSITDFVKNCNAPSNIPLVW